MAMLSAFYILYVSFSFLNIILFFMGKVYAFYTELSKDSMHEANTYNPNNT